MADSPPFIIRGDAPPSLHDLYHRLLTMRWGHLLLGFGGAVVVVNLLFATAYWLLGGIGNAHGFADCFYFSVQTAGTIGYGAMAPTSTTANLVVTMESIVSLVLTALATGVVFTKYARATARLRFAARPCIAPFDGRPTLRLRIGNLRGNSIVEAHIRVVLTRTHRTIEGETFYPQVDLTLVRDHAPALGRAWTVMHVIDDASPLAGATAASLAASEVELSVSVTGVDETTLQTVHARTNYDHTVIAWGMRPADVVSEQAGVFILDLHQFDALVAV